MSRPRRRVKLVEEVSGGGPLPLIDEHATLLAADLRPSWDALLATLEQSRDARSRTFFARALGCSETAGDGRPLRHVGATTPGFRVTEAIPLSRLELRGSHRFSDYALAFELELHSPGTTRVRARTSARFPGRTGRLYRSLVIGTRIHVVAVRLTLRALRRQVASQSWG